MDTTTTQAATDTGEVPLASPAPAVTDALATDTTQPAADPAPNAGDPPDDAEPQPEQPDAPHPFIAAMRQELDKIPAIPAHIWHEIERAFERVAAKL